jgi:Arc/MetJ-type ribon-helix-helix transcriptional regulator
MKKELKIDVRVEKTFRDKIEALIKQEYPALKNYSDVIRVAVQEYIQNHIEPLKR